MKHSLKLWLVIITLIIMSPGVHAQGKSAKTALPKGWHTLDKEKDGVYGISLDKAYEMIRSKNLKSRTVVVAVIDSGIDTLQEDLKDVLWVNPKEIPGNGIDDDHNGYIDDVHGWNFLGGKDGSNVKDDASEEARIYYQYKEKFEDKDFKQGDLDADELDSYKMWLKAKKKIMGDGSEGSAIDLVMLRRVVNACVKSDSVLQKAMGKTEYTGTELEAFQPTTTEGKTARSVLLYLFREEHIMDMTNTMFLEEFKEESDREEKKMELKETAPKNYRKDIVQDDESDINDKYYGNNNIMAGEPMHGTHVAGIIAAERNNGKGMDGIADNVKIMMIRVVPNGDEHDKDIALGIHYAVDNGAKVINMSFGKNLSPEKKWVDEAVMYAAAKGVLLIHAAGNDGADIDTTDNFPNPEMPEYKTRATNWITVGASSDPLAERKLKSYAADFSNFGKKEVDVFAPGVRIYSTLPGGNKYGNLDGTSMASPVVTGVAALILEYFPALTPEQVKYCIEKSATAPLAKTIKPGTENEMVDFSELSQSGGILNAYGAVKLAYTLSTEPKKKDSLPKSTLSNTKE
ncbi:MAG TPA: S8 family peptidase [Puia sp.]|nr:S8 family peptidase [Puia sp.]